MNGRIPDEAPAAARHRGARAFAGAICLPLIFGLVAPAAAVDYQGVVDFSGDAVFAAPIAGIAAQDLTIAVKTATEATGNGEKCSVLATTADNPDGAGTYPDAGSVDAEILLERGGPQIPDGECIVTLTATGSDGVSVSARGAQTVFVPADDIDLQNTVAVADIIVRESKAVAGLDKDCGKWVKKQLKLRDKCNATILKKGGAEALEKCKDAGPEPAQCDPGDHVEAVLALAHGTNDQQADPGSGEAVDTKDLKDQAKCQKRLGKAAVGFAAKYVKLVDNKCVQALIDDEDCRDARANDAKKKLGQIDKCVTDQLVDVLTARTVPVVGAPCDACISGAVLDRKCLKSCFEQAVAELGDGIVGDVPECGNGILQGAEVCDDGNVANGDCCSASCTPENLGDQTCGVGVCEVTVAQCSAGEPVACVPGSPDVEGPNGDPSCGDGLDNDCDTLVDGADPDCL